MKLHLVTTGETDFSYLDYLSVMSAVLKNNVMLWHGDKPEDNKWWHLIEKMALKSDSLELKELDPFTGFTVDATQGDQIGRLDIIYLDLFDEDSIDDGFIDHNLFGQDENGTFERKDITLVRVFVPEGKENLGFITPQYVSANNDLFSALIKRVFLERVWNPYDRE